MQLPQDSAHRIATAVVADCAPPHAEPLPAPAKRATYAFANLDSFSAARAFLQDTTGAAVHNFANARTPGGGFFEGSRAQEESLCRESTLYASLASADATPYYARNRQSAETFYPTGLVYSPHVVVFRDADLALLEKPYSLSVLTVAAPNLHGRARGASSPEIERHMKEQMRLMFSEASKHGVRTLVLGAWGCGAFGHDARVVSKYFRDVLVDEGWDAHFENIIFAVRGAADHENVQAFVNTFADEFADRVYLDRLPDAPLDQPDLGQHTAEAPIEFNRKFLAGQGGVFDERRGYAEGIADDGTPFAAETYTVDEIIEDVESQSTMLSVLIPADERVPSPWKWEKYGRIPEDGPARISGGSELEANGTLIDAGMEDNGSRFGLDIADALIERLQTMGLFEWEDDSEYTCEVYYRTDRHGRRLAMIHISLMLSGAVVGTTPLMFSPFAGDPFMPEGTAPFPAIPEDEEHDDDNHPSDCNSQNAGSTMPPARAAKQEHQWTDVELRVRAKTRAFMFSVSGSRNQKRPTRAEMRKDEPNMPEQYYTYLDEFLDKYIARQVKKRLEMRHGRD